jgi:hypothetical protein
MPPFLSLRRLVVVMFNALLALMAVDFLLFCDLFGRHLDLLRFLVLLYRLSPLGHLFESSLIFFSMLAMVLKVQIQGLGVGEILLELIGFGR